MTSGSGAGPRAGETLRIRVPENAAGTRLDRFLSERQTDRSRSALQRAIGRGEVTVDGRIARAGQRLRAGEEIRYRPAAPEASPLAGEPIPIEIIAEEEEFLVVNKPAGMVVHPAGGVRTGTLVNALLGRGGPLAAGGHPGRPGIVHRLDKGTSGLLIVAKTDRAHRRLADLFRLREVEKRYLALAWGEVRPGKVDLPVDRHPRDRTRMTARSGRGRPSLTRYRPVERFDGFTLLEVVPETGRTHQIRVHFAAIHHPLVGDRTYGGERNLNPREAALADRIRRFGRPALHAWQLALPHPIHGGPLRFRAEPPADFRALLEELRLRKGVR